MATGQPVQDHHGLIVCQGTKTAPPGWPLSHTPVAAGLNDPLPEYEQAFAAIGDEISGWDRTGLVVAVRFIDPKQKRDSARRLIHHEFVAFGDDANLVNSVDDAKHNLWPLVEFAFERAWESHTAPSTADLRFD